MRVISGHAKGRRIKVPKGRALRPTADRVKEALFNILPKSLSGYKVLDLFAGTGNLSAEALSRGASEALLIDFARQARKTARENLQSLDLLNQARIWQAPVTRAVRLLSRRGETFDLVFLDPPYDKGLVESTLRAIANAGIVKESGTVVTEHSMREKVEAEYGPLKLRDQRRYGATVLSFFGLSREEASTDGEI
ncbi:MAG: 16S rRNA (guanine(966)-N(2))-methyltransferase RsmD [Deltaproteobacteria bacterium]|nr:16S rRNA (guanine(966)-N(2))-methyltransferase RsmD [Deltaproteobacteria bacterium]